MESNKHKKDRGYDEKGNMTTSVTQRNVKAKQKDKTKNSDQNVSSTKPKKVVEKNANNIKLTRSMSLRSEPKAHQKLTKVEENKDRGYGKKSNTTALVTQRKFKGNQKNETKNSLEEDQNISSTKPKKVVKKNATDMKLTRSMSLRNESKSHQKLTKIEEN